MWFFLIFVFCLILDRYQILIRCSTLLLLIVSSSTSWWTWMTTFWSLSCSSLPSDEQLPAQGEWPYAIPLWPLRQLLHDLDPWPPFWATSQSLWCDADGGVAGCHGCLVRPHHLVDIQWNGIVLQMCSQLNIQSRVLYV